MTTSSIAFACSGARPQTTSARSTAEKSASPSSGTARTSSARTVAGVSPLSVRRSVNSASVTGDRDPRLSGSIVALRDC